jgi:hypothetical protein
MLDQQQLMEQIELLRAMLKQLGTEASTYVNAPSYWIRKLESFDVRELRNPRCWAAFVLTGYGYQALYPEGMDGALG